MRKALIAAVAAVAAIALTLLLAPSWEVAHASPHTVATNHSPECPDGYWIGAQNLCWPDQAHAPSVNSIVACTLRRPANPLEECDGAVPPTAVAPATTPVRAPSNPPPTQAPATMPVQAPVTKAALVRPPKGLDASPQAIAAAKAAPPTQVDPANPPTPPTHTDFKSQVQSVIKTHNANIDVVNGQAHPRHWDYIDYDTNRHPILYNPMSESMTFRYFYSGDYREVYVAAGSSVVLNVASGGVFPFTAVGDDYLTSGSFNGGAPPAQYQDVNAYIPAYNQTVQVSKVQPAGHDDSQPAGSQDTFMLDDSTLAWGQATNPTDGGQITVTKTQTLPNVGPTDDGKSLVDLAAASHPQSNQTPWLIGALVALVLVIAAGLVAWMVIRRKRSTDLTASA
jgi:hypothetical protein